MLSILLLIAALMLFARMSAFRIPEDWVWRFGILIDTVIFLFGPFTYTYVRRLLYRESPDFHLKWWHYMPACLHLLYYFATLTVPLAEFNTLYFSGKLYLMFFIVEGSGLISFIFYWIKTILLVRRYRGEAPDQLSYNQAILRFVLFLLLPLGIFMLLWGISFTTTNFLGKPFPYADYVTMWVSTPAFIYVVGFFSLRQPEIFRIPLPKSPTSKKDRLKPEQIQKLQKRLQYYISEEKVFLMPELTLKELAEKMNTSSNNLSWLLNQVYQASFYDYINRHRIAAFLNKIDRKEHLQHTLLALAMDVGFNSKSTFNKAFKNEKGTTPSAYIKSLNVA